MASVPLSVNQLETILESVSRQLLEQWAIDDRFAEDQLEKATQWAVDDASLVINVFMEMFNDYMTQQAEPSNNLII